MLFWSLASVVACVGCFLVYLLQLEHSQMTESSDMPAFFLSHGGGKYEKDLF